MYLGYQETNPFCTDPLSEPHLFPKVFLNQESMEFFLFSYQPEDTLMHYEEQKTAKTILDPK